MKLKLLIVAFFSLIVAACVHTAEDDYADETFKKIHDNAQQGG